MRRQVREEPIQPRRVAVLIRPRRRVAVGALEHGAAQFQPRVDRVQRRRPLQVERAVVLGHDLLAVRLFAEFHVADGVAARLDVPDLGRGVAGRAIEHRDGNHRGHAARQAALEDDVEPGLFFVRHLVRGLMPRVD